MPTLRALIEAEHSKKQCNKIVKYVGDDQSRFDELLKINLGKEERLAQCASWPIRYCVKNHPQLATKHLKKIILSLNKPLHHAVRRSLANMLMHVEVPEKLESLLIENCFKVVYSSDELVANRVYAAYAIEKICKKYPQLYTELVSSLETFEDADSAAMRSVTKTIRKKRDRSLVVRSKP